MDTLTIVDALLAVSVLAFVVFVALPNEARGLVSFMVGVALTSMALTVSGAPRLGGLLVWSTLASGVMLLFSTVMFLRLTKEERGARRISIQAVIVVGALVVFALVLGVVIRPAASLSAAISDETVGALLTDHHAGPLVILAFAGMSAYVTTLLAARRRE